MDPNELRRKKADALAQAKGIRALADGRDLTDDESAKITALCDEAEGYEAEAKKIEDAEALDTRLNTQLGSLEVADDAEIAVTSDLQIDADPECGFNGYGDFAKMVYAASAPGGHVDDRLLKMQAAASGQHGGAGGDGGFLNPPGYSTTIYERAIDTLPILADCDRIIMAGPGNSLTLNAQVDHTRNDTTYRNGGVIVYWVKEAGSITASQLKFRQVTLKLNKLAALSYCTEEELSDAFVNFGDRLLNKHSVGIADELVEQVMFGTGVGKPLGAWNSDAVISTAKETGQAADTIVFENIVNMVADLNGPSVAGAKWYYNGEALPQLATMALAVGTGGVPVYLPANGAAGSMPGSLWGRAAYSTEHCEALGDAGDIVLGDMSEYLLATKGDLKTALSIHLRFDYDETAFRSTFRVDGRPTWEQSLRPRKGATAKRVSPWVKLAARA